MSEEEISLTFLSHVSTRTQRGHEVMDESVPFILSAASSIGAPTCSSTHQQIEREGQAFTPPPSIPPSLAMAQNDLVEGCDGSLVVSNRMTSSPGVEEGAEREHGAIIPDTVTIVPGVLNMVDPQSATVDSSDTNTDIKPIINEVQFIF